MTSDQLCVVVTSPVTGETYRVQLAEPVELNDDERRDLALWMDAVAAAAKRKYGKSEGDAHGTA